MARDSRKRQRRVTADAARKITGVGLGPFSIQWADPGPSESKIVRQFLVFLEDRRALYGAYPLELPSEVHRSLDEIRREATTALRELDEGAFAIQPIQTIRRACRRFIDDEREEFRLIGGDGFRHAGPGFFVALGAFRSTVGQQVVLLSARYGIDIEGDLASVLPAADVDDENDFN